MNVSTSGRIACAGAPCPWYALQWLILLLTTIFTIPAEAGITNIAQDTTIDVRGDTAAEAGTHYFSTTRQRATMNTTRVTGEDIARQPVTSLMNAVVGRMTGVDITPASGVAGIAPLVQIRGKNSLTIGTYPLYIVDGVQIEAQPIQTVSRGLLAPGVDPLSTLDPADIESIEVLKDAAATAIYGSRGANGVIRVTTRKAAASSRSGLELSAYTGVGKVSQHLDLLSSRQYLTMRHEALKNAGMPVGPGDWDLNGAWDTTRYTDFQKQLIGNTAKITDVHTAISGGNDQTGIRLTGGYHKEGTVYPGDFGLQRITTGLSFNHSSDNGKFNVIASAYYGWTKNKSFNDADFLSGVLTLPPVTPPLRDSIGNINFANRQFYNPLASFLRTDQVASNQIISNAILSYEILTGLSVKNNLGLQYFAGNEITKNPKAAEAIVTPALTGNATFGNNTRTSLMIEPQIHYNRQFSGHRLNILVGATWQNRYTTYQEIMGTGYQIDAALNTLKGAAHTMYLIDDHTQYKYTSVYARIGYSFRDKYLLDLTNRYDGSSRFAAGKYGSFGALGAAWIFSKESPIKDRVSFLSFGKIRGSYGKTGNDQVPDYLYHSAYSISYPYQGDNTLVPAGPYNPNFAWETTFKTELALELGFFHDRIFLEAAWYNHRSCNLLAISQTPGTTGFSNGVTNIDAAVRNTGTEILLNTRNIITESFRWSSSFNLTMPQNKLVKYPDLENSPYKNSYKVEEPLSVQSLYTCKGIDPQTGLYMFLDKDNNHIYDLADQSFTAPKGRRYYGGLTNTFGYKNFELSLLFQFSKAQVSDFLIHPYPGTISNQPMRVMNRWRHPGDITNEPGFSTASNTTAYQGLVVNSDRNTAMVNFVRLKTASLSYRLPVTLTSRASVSDARLFAQGQNLLTFTSFDQALDPETMNSLPPIRIINIGFQIKL